jgi:hypothetical protein
MYPVEFPCPAVRALGNLWKEGRAMEVTISGMKLWSTVSVCASSGRQVLSDRSPKDFPHTSFFGNWKWRDV